MGANQGKGRYAAGKTAVLLFALFLILLLLYGSGEEELLSGVFLMEASPDGTELLLLEECDGCVWAVFGGEAAVLLKLDFAGNILSRRTLDFPAVRAFFRGGNLFLLKEVEDGWELVRADGNTLEEISRQSWEKDPGSLLDLDCDGAGTVYFTRSEDPDVLCELRESGELSERRFPGELEFLEADREGGLFVYAGGSLFRRAPGSGAFQESPGVVRPHALLGTDRWIDEDGVVCRLDGQEVRPLFSTEEPVFSSRFYCLDRENCLILSVGADSLRKYGPQGEPMGSRRVGKGILGLCAAGAVRRRDAGIFYVPFDLSPSPEPTASPLPSFTPEPVPEDSPAWTEGEFVISRPGLTAAQLREMFEPDTAEIRDALGRLVTEGKLATGMTVNGWTLVILGDCNGTGTVTSRDVYALLEMILDEGAGTKAFRRAGDLDSDGVLGSLDLVYLSQMVEGSAP